VNSTPDGKRFVTIDGSGNALVWNVADQKIERKLPLGGAKTAWRFAISSDSMKAAVCWAPPRRCDEADEDPIQTICRTRACRSSAWPCCFARVLIAPTHGHAGSVAFSPDGRKLALGTNGAIHLFDLTK